MAVPSTRVARTTWTAAATYHHRCMSSTDSVTAVRATCATKTSRKEALKATTGLLSLLTFAVDSRDAAAGLRFRTGRNTTGKGVLHA